MVGLSADEMFMGDLDFIYYRLNGYLMSVKAKEISDLKNARLISFITAKSMGATKAKSAEDFMKIGEEKKKARLTDEQIEKLKNL
jgi:hypothetical protein